MKKLGFFGLMFCFLATGCASTSALQSVSSAEIGCAPDEVKVKNREVNSDVTSWTALCRGKTFYCTGIGGEKSVPRIKCTEETPAAK